MCIDVAYYKPDVMQHVEVTLSVCSQVLSNAAWWHVYADARRVQEVLTDEQRMHQLDLAAFFRHMCQRCHMTCTIFRDEASAFRVLATLRLETPVMDRVKIGLLQLLPQVDQEAFVERYMCVMLHDTTAAISVCSCCQQYPRLVQIQCCPVNISTRYVKHLVTGLSH